MHINWSAWHLCYSIPHIRFQPIIVPIFSSSRPFWSASLGFFFHQAFHWSPTVITHQICDRLVQSLGSPAVMSICNSIDQGIPLILVCRSTFYRSPLWRAGAWSAYSVFKRKYWFSFSHHHSLLPMSWHFHFLHLDWNIHKQYCIV